MKSLINQLHELGLSRPQVDCTLTTIEDWLEEKYPVLAKMYQHQIMNQVYSESDVHLDSEISRSKVV